jgi:hypothetical protein
VELLTQHTLPDFGEDVGKFTNDFRVRVLLQKIFNEYLECYRKMMDLLSIHESC